VVNFVPALYNPAKAVTVTAAGIIVPGSGDLYNGLIRAGNGVPPDQVGGFRAQPARRARCSGWRSPRLFPTVQSAHAASQLRLVAVHHQEEDRDSVGLRNVSRPYPGQPGFLAVRLPAVRQPGGVPERQSLQSIGRRSRQPTPFSVRGIDPNLKVRQCTTTTSAFRPNSPRGSSWTSDTWEIRAGTCFGPEHQHSTLLRAGREQRPPSAGRPVTNSIVPYPGYATITEFLSDSNSNYNALQTYLTRRKGNLFFTVSYTWSKSLSNANNYNDAGDSIEYVSQHFNYGPTGIDRRHIFVATYTYRIPLLRGRHGSLGLRSADGRSAGSRAIRRVPRSLPR